MKSKLLLLALFGTFFLNAQTEHFINWQLGPTGTSITIEVGDTVTWTWTDVAPHTVSSTGGTETFDSGTLSGIGNSFSWTFNSVGATNYQCNIHPSMNGTITVQTLGLQDQELNEFVVYSNFDEIKIVRSNANESELELYDVLGKLIYKDAIETVEYRIPTSRIKKGVYLLRLSDFKSSQTKRVIVN